MNKNKMIALSSPLVFLVFGIWIRVSTLSMTKRDSVFPNLVAYMVIAISIIDFISVYRKSEHKNRFQGIKKRRKTSPRGTMRPKLMAATKNYLQIRMWISFIFPLLTASTMNMPKRLCWQGSTSFVKKQSYLLSKSWTSFWHWPEKNI